MNRLLQGDVGSGKTIVAAQAAVIAVENGYQVAVLAPTEILANQHYSYFKRLLEKLGYVVAALTGSARSGKTANQRKDCRGPSAGSGRHPCADAGRCGFRETRAGDCG